MYKESESHYDIVPVNLAIKAMRDSGYKSTAHAIAELIDNSVQAEADVIEVLCFESTEKIIERKRSRVSSIAVVDNGCGMDFSTLRMSLQFGNGTRLNSREGIGRFGMGLPNASISQCSKLEVWSWQNGIGNALYTYLDIEEIQNKQLGEVPEPVLQKPPKEIVKDSRNSNVESGTIVKWTQLDQNRLTWKTAKSILYHTNDIAGRIYRKFLIDNDIKIRLVSIKENGDNDQDDLFDDMSSNFTVEDNTALPNDPLYLIYPSSTPEPFDAIPMFDHYGNSDTEFTISNDGKEGKVIVRCSYAKQETIPKDGSNRGDKKYGKHAANNIGVSLVRAKRELDLDPSWAISYDPTERWWGVEVEFDPVLDENFGVTNNKQSAVVFAQMANFDWKSESDPDESYTQFIDRLIEEGDPRGHLVKISDHIKNQIVKLRQILADQTKGIRSQNRYLEADQIATRASNKWKERGKERETEYDKMLFNKDAKKRLINDLINNKNYPDEQAHEIANLVESEDRKIVFLVASLNSLEAFFDVDFRPGGIVEITFNREHPAFSQLIEVLSAGETAKETDDDLIERIKRASDTIKMLFTAWARLEVEDMPNKKFLKRTRNDWGRMAEDFLSD